MRDEKGIKEFIEFSLELRLMRHDLEGKLKIPVGFEMGRFESY